LPFLLFDPRVGDATQLAVDKPHVFGTCHLAVAVAFDDVIARIAPQGRGDQVRRTARAGPSGQAGRAEERWAGHSSSGSAAILAICGRQRRHRWFLSPAVGSWRTSFRPPLPSAAGTWQSRRLAWPAVRPGDSQFHLRHRVRLAGFRANAVPHAPQQRKTCWTVVADRGSPRRGARACLRGEDRRGNSCRLSLRERTSVFGREDALAETRPDQPGRKPSQSAVFRRATL
jgi:hypothetical protein